MSADTLCLLWTAASVPSVLADLERRAATGHHPVGVGLARGRHAPGFAGGLGISAGFGDISSRFARVPDYSFTRTSGGEAPRLFLRTSGLAFPRWLFAELRGFLPMG
jgi:hypothetical protein